MITPFFRQMNLSTTGRKLCKRCSQITMVVPEFLISFKIRVFSGKTGQSGTGSQTGIKQGPGRNRSRLQRKASRSPSEGGPEASGKQAWIGRKPLRVVPCCGSTSPKRRQARIGRKPANIGSGRIPDAQESAQERPLAYAAAWDASRPMGARAERLLARTPTGGTYRGRLGAR